MAPPGKPTPGGGPAPGCPGGPTGMEGRMWRSPASRAVVQGLFLATAESERVLGFRSKRLIQRQEEE